MSLVPVPSYEYRRLLGVLGLSPDTPIARNGGVVFAEQYANCHYVDPLVFRVVVGREPEFFNAALVFEPHPGRSEGVLEGRLQEPDDRPAETGSRDPMLE